MALDGRALQAVCGGLGPGEVVSGQDWSCQGYIFERGQPNPLSQAFDLLTICYGVPDYAASNHR